MTLLHPWTPPSTFDVQTELQGLYDEISQATLQFVTESDVDLFHDVLYTPDWVFVDATGQKYTWPQMREREVQALSAPPLSSMNQTIQTLSLTPDGRYGRQGVRHTLTETTPFRDTWVKAPPDNDNNEKWKLKSRQQIGRPTVAVDKPELKV
jgi:hypothetical protein